MRKMEATLGAGCFWCIEACFKDLDGVISVVPGYAGGSPETANYKDVCTGKTEHAEVAHVIFDTDQLSFDEILEMFWFVHNPTQLNRQGNDVGPQYRSAIFYHDDEQKSKAELYMQKLSDENVWDKPIVTQIVPLEAFYSAEDHHRNYFELNPQNQYCQFVVRPKVEKFKEVFAKRLNA
jgi:peptide-methionine (S)-S-oxide reductase